MASPNLVGVSGGYLFCRLRKLGISSSSSVSLPKRSPLGAGRLFTLGLGAVAADLRRPKNPNGLRVALAGVASGIGAGETGAAAGACTGAGAA